MRDQFSHKRVSLFWSKVEKLPEPDGCWLWRGTLDKDGYGTFTVRPKPFRAHRYAYELAHGPIPAGLVVCHNCPGGDNPTCVRPDHLWLGTNADNVADRDAKGRTAAGDRTGSRLYPERRPRGDRHGTHTKPESVLRGDQHPSRLHPERMARGNRHGMRLHPERVPRAETNGMAKLDWPTVRAIRSAYLAGGVSQTTLAKQFGINQTTVSCIVLNKTWRE